MGESYPDNMFAVYEYQSYEEYKQTQVYFNKKKIKNVWADEATLEIVARHLESNFQKKNELFGICHGSRNGFEQNWLSKRLSAENIIGTDISETAVNFPKSVVWDFHDVNPEWTNHCDFIYTNSWDQSWKPREALKTWLSQVKVGCFVFIEHTRVHGLQGQSKMDPFGATPEFVPYLLADWFGDQISLEIKKGKKSNMKDYPVWLFIVKRMV